MTLINLFKLKPVYSDTLIRTSNKLLVPSWKELLWNPKKFNVDEVFQNLVIVETTVVNLPHNKP